VGEALRGDFVGGLLAVGAGVVGEGDAPTREHGLRDALEDIGRHGPTDHSEDAHAARGLAGAELLAGEQDLDTLADRRASSSFSSPGFSPVSTWRMDTRARGSAGLNQRPGSS
jgi:hypothetical protein